MDGLSADSRMVMTGTPLKGDNPHRWLRQFQNLLEYILDSSSRPGGENSFAQKIIDPLRKGTTAQYATALRELEMIMRRTVVHHDKSLLKELALPKERVCMLTPSASEARAYNSIVQFALANVLLTLMPGDGSGSGWPLSLLHPDNSQSLAEMIHNILQSCVGGGEQVRASVACKSFNVDKLTSLTSFFFFLSFL